MKPFASFSSIAILSLVLGLSVRAEAPPPPGNIAPLFDGRTLAGWEGDAKLWRVEDGCLTGGSHTETVLRNEFLASTRDCTNFIVRFKIKLTGREGFINSGFQIRSQRVPRSSEMAGYQCDYGEPDWYGAIYDESRRNKVLSPSDMKALGPVLKRQEWNDYVIRADGPRLTTWINGVQGTDYTESDPAIPDWGKFGIQVHGGGKAVVQVKEITLEELPPTPPGKKFIGAPEPKKSGKASPLSPPEERAEFTLPPGFEIELVAAESEGVGKFVTVDWDQQGRMWSMTALEYPVDANENPSAAKELYASKARDKVLVFDRDPQSPTGYSSQPRVFADGLAIPLGLLPYKNGVYVQHGPDIVFLSDTDGDGKADKREVILSGFGVQDSHLFPHQFTRAPGGWIWMAQGAFNYGKVRTTTGKEQPFDQTRMAKFRYDGSDFEITSQGPCNIWGLVLTAEGEAWIQEANDYGYPVMPFHEYANYPGCSDAQFKSYAPEFPGTAPHFQMGGTGLSGLALSDGFQSHRASEAQPNAERGARSAEQVQNLRASAATATWPEAYCDVMYVANPITRKIQAIKITRDGPRFRYQKLPDFVLSSDEMFRPVSIHFGPDGCLYVVDWYNKIISHNEVPRNHPDRDKKRGRIWRVKHREQKPLDVPDFTTLSGDELIAKLGGASTPQSHLAWQAIGDRRMQELAPSLKRLVNDPSQAPGKRISGLWALEALQKIEASSLLSLLTDANRHIRREAVRASGNAGFAPGELFYGSPVSADADAEVRAEVIRAAGRFLVKASDAKENPEAANAIRILINGPSLAPLQAPTMKSTHNGKVIKAGEAYDREFQRYLTRFFLEQKPELVATFLQFDSQGRDLANTVLATLALQPRTSARHLADLFSRFSRAPSPGHMPPIGQEEVLRLAQYLDEPGVNEALKGILQQPATSTATLEALLKVRTRLDTAKLTPLLSDTAKQLLSESNPGSLELGVKLASSFQLAAVEPELVRIVKAGQVSRLPRTGESPILLSALRALREIKSGEIDLFAALAKDSGDSALQTEAVAALAASRDPRGPQQLAGLYPNLSVVPRRTALTSLASTKPGAHALAQAVTSGVIPKDDLDAAMFDKLHAVLGDDPGLAAFMRDLASLFRPVLRLDGKDASYIDSKLTLAGPFTVETWAKLEGDISNRDGILGAPNVLDINFAGALFRVWISGGQHDVVIAKKKSIAGVWTHYAVTRDAKGVFRIFINGELDATGTKSNTNTFAGVDIGRTIPNDAGTDGWLTEYRVWNRARTAEEIRADFDRSYDPTGPAARLPADFNAAGTAAGAGETPALLYSGTNWGKLHGGAKIVPTSDFPQLLTPGEARALAEKFSKFRALAEKPGDLARGQTLFKNICQQCHSVGGQGGQVGPVLSGAGALGVEALLRNILTPNAAMEPGYRAFRVELKDGDVLDGMLVSQDQDAIILRRPNLEDTRLAQKDVRRAAFTKMSMMPEGLLDPLQPEEVADLFAFLQTLK
jgi:putative membrane-bound dehydrogenase-like protein